MIIPEWIKINVLLKVLDSGCNGTASEKIYKILCSL
jgi:hypothetical protein